MQIRLKSVCPWITARTQIWQIRKGSILGFQRDPYRVLDQCTRLPASPGVTAFIGFDTQIAIAGDLRQRQVGIVQAVDGAHVLVTAKEILRRSYDWVSLFARFDIAVGGEEAIRRRMACDHTFLLAAESLRHSEAIGCSVPVSLQSKMLSAVSDVGQPPQPYSTPRHVDVVGRVGRRAVRLNDNN
jgi:hypothetical protein